MTDNTVYEGKKWLTANAPIETIPWFIRCGVIVPMLSDSPSSTMNLHPKSITLFLALPSRKEEMTSWLFEDDGLSFKRNAGKCIDTRFTVNHQKGVTAVVADTAGMKYPGYCRKEFLINIATDKKITVHSGQLQLDKNKGRYRVKNSGDSMELLITES
jgi:alpha-glucosidase